MLRPPSLKFLPYYPITSAVAAGAIAVSTMWWTGKNIDVFTMDDSVWSQWQLWRALTSTLPHVNFFHLAFNLYWLWTFGTVVERIYGHLKCAVIYLLLAVFPMLAEFALLNGGVGLSGLGYGLWGLLMILERRDPRFADVVDRQTNQMFIGWFFLCIVLTITKIMPVANIAHGMGAVMGMLLGLAIAGNRKVQWQSTAALAVLTILIFLGSTMFWPQVNQSNYAAEEIESVALKALDRDDVPRGVKLLEIAVHKRNAPSHTWYNLGVAYTHAGRMDDAAAAFIHAAQMPDASAQAQAVAQQFRQPPAEVNTNQ